MGTLIVFDFILYSRFFRYKYKNLTSVMSLDEIKEKYNSGKDQSNEAFEELCALVETMEAEREERREAATARLNHLREVIVRLRERNQRLRGRYAVVVDMYNELVEEKKDR